MRQHIVILLTVFVVIQEGNVSARTNRTREQQIANTIRHAVDIYAKERKRLPSTWVELSEYVDVAKLGVVQGESVEDAFELLTTSDAIVSFPPGKDEKKVVVVGKKAVRRDEESAELGRYVVFATKELGIRVEWLSEETAVDCLGRWIKSELIRRPKPIVAIDVRITNPEGDLLPLEPVCLTVSLSATNSDAECRVELCFEVRRPDGRVFSIPLDPLHDLRNDTRVPTPTMVKRKGVYGVDLLVALWLVSTNGSYDVNHPVFVSREPGKYSIVVRDVSGGASSCARTFSVMNERLDPVAEFLESPEGQRGFFGDLWALPAYKDTLRANGTSKWSPWCAAILGMHMFRDLGQDGSSTSATAGEVMSFLKGAEAISFESLFDLRLSYVRAALEIRVGHEREGERILRRIVERYKGVSGALEVKEAERQIEEVKGRSR
jgi:hypothetical protein